GGKGMSRERIKLEMKGESLKENGGIWVEEKGLGKSVGRGMDMVMRKGKGVLWEEEELENVGDLWEEVGEG
ncbi:hypothetical protein, partial [Neisseria sicca]|uniref:hypothetical protein n=1 Tax=Neisseria sicca TaxID=490 RepID=UPI003F68B6C2